MYDWFQIFDYNEFVGAKMVSKNLRVFLEGVGFEDILITNGFYVSVVFRDVILPIEFNGENPYKFGDTYAVYKDESGKVFIGIKVE